MCIFKTGLSRSYDSWAKYKEKVPDVSDPSQMLKQHAIPNSILHNLKTYQKGAENLAKDKLYVCS